MASYFLQVEGLRELNRELRGSPERLDKGLRKSFRDMAAEIRDRARAKASAQRPSGASGGSSTQHWADLIRTITSGATGDSPTVKVGSARVPWALGYEFGSNRFGQFPRWRGSGSGAGYFFWPAIRESRDEIEEGVFTAIDEALRPAFPD